VVLVECGRHAQPIAVPRTGSTRLPKELLARCALVESSYWFRPVQEAQWKSMNCSSRHNVERIFEGLSCSYRADSMRTTSLGRVLDPVAGGRCFVGACGKTSFVMPISTCRLRRKKIVIDLFCAFQPKRVWCRRYRCDSECLNVRVARAAAVGHNRASDLAVIKGLD